MFFKYFLDLMFLSYFDLECLEDMRNEDLLSRLSGNALFRSKDDFVLITRVKREVLLRNMRLKFERRRNNIRIMYVNV